VIGSMISLGYYLPVIAAMWMREAPGGETLATTGTPPLGAPGGGPLPALAGGSSELDAELAGGLTDARPSSAVQDTETATGGVQFEVAFVAILAGAATIFFGIIPQPLFELVHHAGTALSGLF
jgi:NADH-quinone oxidoreductase subunit N